MKITHFHLEHCNPSIGPMYRVDVFFDYYPSNPEFQAVVDQVAAEGKVNGEFPLTEYAKAVCDQDKDYLDRVAANSKMLEEKWGPESVGGTCSTLTIHFDGGHSARFRKHRTPNLGQAYWTIAEAMVKNGTRSEYDHSDPFGQQDMLRLEVAKQAEIAEAKKLIESELPEPDFLIPPEIPPKMPKAAPSVSEDPFRDSE